MKFAVRKRTAEIVLNVGQSKRYLLPPIANGFIDISVHSVFRPNEVEPPDDGTGTPPSVFDLDLNASRRAAESGSADPGVVVMERDNPLNTNNPATDIDPDPDGPGGGGGGGTDSGPSRDIKLELKRIRRTIKTTDIGKLVHETSAPSSDWNIIITRKQDAFPQRRRFRIVVTYPSILPEEERRVPLEFLRRGFDLNWNKLGDGQHYVRGLSIYSNKLTYYLEPVFAALYHLEASNENDPINLVPDYSTWWVELPPIRNRGPVEFEVGVDTETDMAIGGPRVYFALKIKVFCDGRRNVHIRGANDVDLHPEFWIHVRFYPVCLEGGMLCYHARVLTSLDLDYSVVLDIVDKELPDLKRYAEHILHLKQWDENNRSLFDKHLKPWMVGNYEVTGLHYDPATDDLVIRHVGKPIERPIAANPDPDAPTGTGWNMVTNPRPYPLFKTAGEVWASAPPVAGEPGPMRPTTSPGALAKIDHIVVLMQENRSFDHILGHLSRDLGHDEVEGLLPGDNNRDWNDCDRIEWRDQGIRFHSRRITDTTWPAAVDNPCHGHHCTMRQMSDGMKHFVSDFSERVASRDDAQRVMDYFGDGVLKAYDGLKKEFAICDRWFGSHIGGTLPNRHITFSGDLNRDPLGAPEEENSHLSTYCPSERATFFDHLTSRGVSWKLYEHGYSFLRLYRKYTFDIANVRGFGEFLKAAATGTLPSVTFIEPDYIEMPNGNDDHAPADMIEGQRLIARVVRALITSPLWERTMLIITYDEHGGFYDHLVPPDSIETLQPDGTTATRRIPPIANGIRQLGPRVPAFVISPFTPGAGPDPRAIDPTTARTRLNVSKRVYEHASIPATILRRFCSPRPQYLSARVDAAHDLGELLSLERPRPASEFASLLAKLDEVIAAPPHTPTARAAPVPVRKKLPGTLGETEDFHGFIAYASAITGRGTS
jgi:phospholipase C